MEQLTDTKWELHKEQLETEIRQFKDVIDVLKGERMFREGLANEVKAEVARLQEENKLQRGALEFYADQNHYAVIRDVAWIEHLEQKGTEITLMNTSSPILDDGGQRAQAALEDKTPDA